MKFNDNGEIVDPEFHDGNLTGIRITKKSLQLYLTTIDSKNFIITISDIVRIRVNNFLEGNIIFDITVYKNTLCQEEKLKILYGYNEEQAAKHLPANLRDIANKKLSLLELGSSYGCELLVLFSGLIQIEDERTNSTGQP